MSSVYSLEPGTRGVLTLRTSHGPIAVSLWSDESPHAVKNIVQHALNSYYDGVAFHRVVPGVLVQTGDPTGTGTGGESAFPSRKLQRELHGRLKFRRRGLVALVADDAGECRSQFFITLAETSWLNGAHTIFGSVEGNTIFNLLSLAEAAQDADEPPKLLSIDITENPFSSLVRTVKDVQPVPKLPNQDTVRKGKNRMLLSFAADDDESGDERPFQRGKAFPTAVPIRPSTATQVQNHLNASRSPTEDKVDKTSAARAEFNRLLSQMSRKIEVPESSVPAVVRQGEKPHPKPNRSTVSDDVLPSAAASRYTRKTVGNRTGRVVRDELSVRPGRNRAKNSGREADVLRKLAGFEKRLLAARSARNGRSGSKEDAAPSTQWFAQPLKLAAASDGPVEEEYIAVEGIPSGPERQ